MRELMRGERLLYREDKAVKAEARREMQKILQERYEDPEGLRQFQLARCARKIEEGLGTLEDEAYIRKYAGRTRVLGSFEPQEYQHPQPVSIDVFLQTLPQVDQVDA
ncbi:MAG: hypothetical protein HY431_00315 [Candidatus Levybacteria bacterium]|nr:hypothetical protein [Candidatus Levybacteria bacterium]